jgi:hypothetical protein
MHEPMGEIAVSREQQQTRCVEVQSADRDPSPSRRRRKPFEYSRAPFGILARRQLAAGLVIRQIAVRAVDDGELYGAAVEQDALFARHRLAKLGAAAVDEDTAFVNPALDLASRADACIGQELLNALGQDQ